MESRDRTSKGVPVSHGWVDGIMETLFDCSQKFRESDLAIFIPLCSFRLSGWDSPGSVSQLSKVPLII